MAPSTLTITLPNTTTSSTVFAHVTGIPVDASKGSIFFLLSDGKTPYYPSNPSTDQSPLGKNVAIPLAAPNSASPTKITVPQLVGARISISIGKPLTFLINKGPAIVMPSITNSSDLNFNILWDFCEFTFDAAGLFANITYVDFVAIPIALTLINASGTTTHVSGLPSNGLSLVGAAMRAQTDSPDWAKLIYPAVGSPLRILSPNSLSAVDPSKFQGYYEPYLNAIWSEYATKTLKIDTQNTSFGTYTGRVTNNTFVFTNPQHPSISFTKPSSRDVFSCSTGPFGGLGNTVAGNIAARLCAALNRSTLDTVASQPDGANAAAYYLKTPTNQYSRVCHVVNIDHKGYAFPYDDVVPGQGAADQAGIVADANPASWVVTVGGSGVVGAQVKPLLKVVALAKAATVPSAQNVLQAGDKAGDKGVVPVKRRLAVWQKFKALLKRR